MNLIKTISKTIDNLFKPKAFDPMENIDLNKVVGWHSVGGSDTYGYYKSNQYENGYSSIRVLSEGFAVIEPYTINKDGISVPGNILDRIYTPNNQMSAYDFREALMVCSLVLNKVRIRVHHSGTKVNADSIKGFTFMENYNETVVDGKRQYRLQNGEALTDDTVITLKSFDPNDFNNGFSPSRAAMRWTTLDDYIADYQKGFFRNGAVPAGQMIITARTTTEYNDIVDTLQERHRGAGKNNNITYSHRPTDQNGAPLNSQIEWVPFSTQNKDMALKDLFDNVNKKIDSAYGVPASIRAVNDANTYASVRVDELILVKYGLNPKTLKVWSKFTHELNRICNGTGVAITYELEMPKIADEEKVKAEARKVDADTVASLVEQGFTLDSAIEYVKEGDLDSLIKSQIDIEEDPVVTSDEPTGTPDQPIDGYKGFKPKQLSEVDRHLAELRIKVIVRDQLSRQVEKAISELDGKLKAFGDPDPQQDEAFVNQMLTVIIPVLSVYGSIQTSKGIELIVEAGLSTEGIQRFFVTEEQRAAYKAYLDRIGTYFNEQTAQEIRKVLDNAITNQLPRREIENGLREIVKQQWRIDRLATTEINRAGGRASVMSMANIKRDTGYDIQKTMQHNGSDQICEFCAARIGVWYPVTDAMVQEGEIVKGIDGGLYVNSWEDNFGNDIHANGHCSPVFRVKR